MREVDIWNIHHSSGSRQCELLSAAAAAAAAAAVQCRVFLTNR